MTTHALPRQRIHEIAGVVQLAAACLTLLALLTYSSSDAAWNVAASGSQTANWAGRAGAWLADILYQLFGFPVLALPLWAIAAGYRQVRGRSSGPGWRRLSAGATLLLAIGVLLALVAPSLPDFSSFAPGGLIGAVAAGGLIGVLNRAGSLIVVIAAMAASLLVLTSQPVDDLMTAGGRRIGSLIRRLPFGRRQSGEDSAQQRERLPVPLETLTPHKTLDIPCPPSSKEDAPPEPEVRLEAEFAALVEGRGAPAPTEPSRLVPELDGDEPLVLPSLDFLRAPEAGAAIDRDRLFERARQLTAKYAEFDVRGKVLQIHPGPVVTTFEFKPDPGVKYSKVTSLEQDLCLGLKAESVRIDRIPGKNTVGVEVPNDSRQTILLREILASSQFQEAASPLTVALGKRINGNTYIADLAKMPHLLIAGATGSGKSVALNCMVCSVLYKSQPAQVRFIMVDPKRLELGLYADIPHLLTPIVTDPKEASNALKWAVSEMEQRYKLLARRGVRNISQFNQLMAEVREKDEAEGDQCVPLPYIVIVVDELADLMMTTGKDVEASLTRLAQMARAIGIHLILATQRPSVDVITGLIKANFPCRVSFRVSSKIDSRTIIDGNGAEALLGHGDMLFLPPGTSRLVRLHGPFVSEKEIARVTEFLRRQAQPQYQEEILVGDDEEEGGLIDAADLHDDLYDEAARFVVETRKASTSLLQRRFRIGYGRAARLLDMMEHEGLISAPDGSKARDVLVPVDYFDEIDRR